MAGAVGARRLPPTPVSNPSATAHAMASLAKLLTALPSALASSADRVYLKTENVTGNEEFFALSKTFFRRNTDVFQEKMTRRGVKRPAVRVCWALEEYTLAFYLGSIS